MDNNPTFPQPPVHPLAIRGRKLIYQSCLNTFMAARAAAESAITDKDAALEELIDALKSDIRYAENTVNFDDDKLKFIGWSGNQTPTALLPPGEVRQLEAPKQGNGWVFLDWKPLTAAGLSRIKCSAEAVETGRMSRRQSRQNQRWLTNRKAQNSNIAS